jgi:hypothetical protein
MRDARAVGAIRPITASTGLCAATTRARQHRQFQGPNCHRLVPVPVSPGGGDVECPDGCDPVARQHRQRKVFRSCAAKGHAPKFTRRNLD